MIQMYNESLVYELAQREDLEFEKELKNTFISLLLSIQNKRRNYQLDRKRKGAKALTGPSVQSPQVRSLFERHFFELLEDLAFSVSYCCCTVPRRRWPSQ